MINEYLCSWVFISGPIKVSFSPQSHDNAFEVLIFNWVQFHYPPIPRTSFSWISLEKHLLSVSISLFLSLILSLISLSLALSTSLSPHHIYCEAMEYAINSIACISLHTGMAWQGSKHCSFHYMDGQSSCLTWLKHTHEMAAVYRSDHPRQKREH